MFKVEAEQRVNFISSGLIDLEKTSGAEKQLEILEALFREAHSLKGACRAVKQAEIETICQSLESIFAAWKRREVIPSPELFGSLHDVANTLKDWLLTTTAENAAFPKDHLTRLIKRVESLSQGSAGKNQG